jgi:bacillopeptidase F (M6 metalloprotease family)
VRQTTSVLVPASGKLRITYAVVPFAPVVGHGMLRYRLTATGTLHSLPTPSVNRGPWGISPGWSSAKWDLSALAGKRIYLHFNTDDSSASVALSVDDVRVYSCG